MFIKSHAKLLFSGLKRIHRSICRKTRIQTRITLRTIKSQLKRNISTLSLDRSDLDLTQEKGVHDNFQSAKLPRQ